MAEEAQDELDAAWSWSGGGGGDDATAVAAVVAGDRRTLLSGGFDGGVGLSRSAADALYALTAWIGLFPNQDFQVRVRTSDNAFAHWRWASRPQYAVVEPAWLSMLSLGLLRPRTKALHARLVPNTCPYVYDGASADGDAGDGASLAPANINGAIARVLLSVLSESNAAAVIGGVGAALSATSTLSTFDASAGGRLLYTPGDETESGSSYVRNGQLERGLGTAILHKYQLDEGGEGKTRRRLGLSLPSLTPTRTLSLSLSSRREPHDPTETETETEFETEN